MTSEEGMKGGHCLAGLPCCEEAFCPALGMGHSPLPNCPSTPVRITEVGKVGPQALLACTGVIGIFHQGHAHDSWEWGGQCRAS